MQCSPFFCRVHLPGPSPVGRCVGCGLPEAPAEAAGRLLETPANSYQLESRSGFAEETQAAGKEAEPEPEETEQPEPEEDKGGGRRPGTGAYPHSPGQFPEALHPCGQNIRPPGPKAGANPPGARTSPPERRTCPRCKSAEILLRFPAEGATALRPSPARRTAGRPYGAAGLEEEPPGAPADGRPEPSGLPPSGKTGRTRLEIPRSFQAVPTAPHSRPLPFRVFPARSRLRLQTHR